ncbi:MAG: DUF885 domain-containing protein [Kangiellaceae bacterium]|nr:DUF885 domain-containing protein [Kangiellaceae bacterium]
MKINHWLLAVVAPFISACSQPDTTKANNDQTSKVVKETAGTKVVDQNVNFEAFKSQFIEAFWKENPGYALYVGYYKYDDQLVIPNKENSIGSLNFAKSYLSKLAKFNPRTLDNGNASDYYIIKNRLESTEWYISTYKGNEWNPSRFNVAGAFGLILNTDYKSLDERLKTISTRLENIPAYYEAAISNITVPTLEHTALAIQQNKGALGIFESSIPAKLIESGLTDQEKSEIKIKLKQAVESINSYISWLQSKHDSLADGGAKNFRIGKTLYQQKFKLDIVSDYSADELYQRAIVAKNELHKQMIEITTELWPKYFQKKNMPEDKLVAVKQLIDHLSVKHVERDQFVNEVKRQIPLIEAYINEADLLDMDPSRPLVVRETPEYQRGIAGASVNAPGPYDATANTYYNVTPLDHFNDEQAESYLREYNHWILQILNIHEAVPGHYVQLVHSNKSPSMIKAIFGNGAMVEGWAVYSEKMMLESGYGNQEPELWLMYSKWNLRVVVNTILDYSIQVLDMNKEDGLNLLTNQAFQEKTEAEGKWRRATLSQVQLTSYFNGFAEIYEFREAMKKEQGDKFNLKAFHNEFLSYGSAPVPIIKQLMREKIR